MVWTLRPTVLREVPRKVSTHRAPLHGREFRGGQHGGRRGGTAGGHASAGVSRGGRRHCLRLLITITTRTNNSPDIFRICHWTEYLWLLHQEENKLHFIRILTWGPAHVSLPFQHSQLSSDPSLDLLLCSFHVMESSTGKVGGRGVSARLTFPQNPSETCFTLIPCTENSVQILLAAMLPLVFKFPGV